MNSTFYCSSTHNECQPATQSRVDTRPHYTRELVDSPKVSTHICTITPQSDKTSQIIHEVENLMDDQSTHHIIYDQIVDDDFNIIDGTIRIQPKSLDIAPQSK